MKALIRILAIALIVLPLAYAAQTAKPAFEAATIKPDNDDRSGEIGGSCRGRDTRQSRIPFGRCVFDRVTLKQLINVAYRLSPDQVAINHLVLGGPSWASSDWFDVEAKAEDPEHTTRAQLEVMLQTLLAERFELKFHREKREVQGFELLIAKTGAKLKEATAQRGNVAIVVRASDQGSLGYNGPASRIDALASFLTGRLSRPVIDKTGLTGIYDVQLRWIAGVGESGRGPTPPVGVASEPGPSLFSALQEQLGLRLESTRVIIDALVIDSAERPTGQ